MANYYSALLTVPALFLTTSLIASEPIFSVIPGAQLNVVDVNGNPIHSADLVCREDSCYTIETELFLPPAIKKRFGLRDTNYRELTHIAETSYPDGRLILPSSLGIKLYNAARKENIRDIFRDD